jgi:hypothetical protein
MPMHTLWTACKLPCLGPYQATRTALLPRPADMFLRPLGVVYHLHFTAQQSDVPDLSCTHPNTASLPVSFQAPTRSRLHCLTPAQFPRVPHHPGCNVVSPEGLDSISGWFSGPSDNVQGVKSMQVWACMAVRSISNRKAFVRRAALTQFGFRSASPKARALRGLGQAVRAWDATSGWCAPDPRLAQTLLNPSGRSHTCATYCGRIQLTHFRSMPNQTAMCADQAPPYKRTGGGFSTEPSLLWVWRWSLRPACERPCGPSQRAFLGLAASDLQRLAVLGRPLFVHTSSCTQNASAQRCQRC